MTFVPGSEADYLGYAQGVEHVVLVQVFNVFTRDDVYFGVPVRIEVVEGGELPFLLLCQVGKVFKKKLHSVFPSGMRGGRKFVLLYS